MIGQGAAGARIRSNVFAYANLANYVLFVSSPSTHGVRPSKVRTRSSTIQSITFGSREGRSWINTPLIFRADFVNLDEEQLMVRWWRPRSLW